ncbi:uncharacterized protein MJ0912 [Anaerolineaceae bacterium]|nr:uncharacterized protein MJ0912 [Anaerolineaceae bacterium]
MVATQASEIGQRPHRIRALIGIGAVTHHVAQAPNGIVRAVRVRQHGLQRGKVGVNVRHYQHAHQRARCHNGKLLMQFMQRL